MSILCRKFEKSVKSFLDSSESVIYFLKNQGFGKARGNPLQRRAARSREPAVLLCTPPNGPALENMGLTSDWGCVKWQGGNKAFWVYEMMVLCEMIVDEESYLHFHRNILECKGCLHNLPDVSTRVS